MKKNAIILILITITVKIISMLKDMVLAYYFGTSEITDVYIISLTIPSLFFAFFLSAIKSSFIPKYVSIQHNDSIESGERFSNSITNLIVLLMSLIILFVFIFTKQIIFIVAPGFNEELVNITVSFTRISIFSILFTSLVSLYSGLLNVNNLYIAPAISMIPMQIALILSIFLASKINNYFLAYGYLLATFIQLLFLFPFLKKIKYKYNIKMYIQDKNVRSFIITILPIFISVAISDISKIVDKALASTFNIGAISTLDYAHKLTGIVESIVVLSILTAVFPLLAKNALLDKTKFIKKFKESFMLISLISIPAMMGYILMNYEIVALVYGRGAFDNNSVSLTSIILLLYSPTIVFYSLRSLYIRAFYAFENTKITLFNTIFTIIINISLNIIFYYCTSFGIYGLALSSTISSFISLITISFALRVKLGKIFNLIDYFELFKIILATILMMLVITIFKHFNLILSNNIKTILLIVISAIIYFIFLVVFRNRDVVDFIKVLKNKINEIKIIR